MIVAGHSDGSVRAQLKDIDGTWPGTWTTVGDASITPAGSPSAVFSPTTGRMYAFVRATDGSIYWSRQTEPGSATWMPWDVVSLGGTHATDPDRIHLAERGRAAGRLRHPQRQPLGGQLFRGRGSRIRPPGPAGSPLGIRPSPGTTSRRHRSADRTHRPRKGLPDRCSQQPRKRHRNPASDVL